MAKLEKTNEGPPWTFYATSISALLGHHDALTLGTSALEGLVVTCSVKLVTDNHKYWE